MAGLHRLSAAIFGKAVGVTRRAAMLPGLPAVWSYLGFFLLAAVAAADPGAWKAEGWTKTDFDKTRIAWDEVLSGGPPKDGIPSIDRPKFRSIGEITDLAPNDPVIGLEIAGDARAYPLRVLIWHEIVNDMVGEIPVAVTYCPLCNAAIVFDRRIGDRVLDFGTTGKLRKSDLVMYDRQTESWWQQFTGEAIVGEFAGQTLKLLPARLESFSDFKQRQAAGKVLVPDTEAARNYGRNPYAGYDSAATPFLYRGDFPKGIEPMARVVVARNGSGSPTIVSMALVREKTPLRIGSVLFLWKSGQASAVDTETISEGRDVGAVEVYRERQSGERTLIPYDVTFAFVAHAFHPGVKIKTE
jgi:hypothetical protein